MPSYTHTPLNRLLAGTVLALGCWFVLLSLVGGGWSLAHLGSSALRSVVFCSWFFAQWWLRTSWPIRYGTAVTAVVSYGCILYSELLLGQRPSVSFLVFPFIVAVLSTGVFAWAVSRDRRRGKEITESANSSTL